MVSILEVQDLTKYYGTQLAVDRTSFSIESGEIFGFLGPNGAGKTTTINMLTGLARPTTGKIYYFGQDYTQNIKKAQHLMGIVPDESNLYPELSGFENLCFCGALYGLKKKERESRAKDLLEVFGLSDAMDKKFSAYSRGMKRRLTIAAGIIHKPPILFLDEPTTGIDVASARHIRRLLLEMNKNGTTIFLTTHYIEEAERLCHRVAFIVEGRIIKIDHIDNLLHPVKDRNILLLTLSKIEDGIETRLSAILPEIRCVRTSDNEIKIESIRPLRVAQIIRILEENNIEVIEARRMTPSLEDVFVDVTGIEAETMKKEKEKKEGQG
ncbi:MAG TPA: ABC transporter ATP-binding protein [Syntrophorhabdaceae bacterium]|nr:ABC transporter ATP-binding protein [Syntrophorhabdaceae bacterium]